MKNPDTIKNVAAVKYLNIISANAADMFHNTTVKQNADMFLNTIVYKNAKCAKNGFAIANAAILQNTIGNMFANPIAAQHQHPANQAAKPAAADNRCIVTYCKSGESSFHLTFPLLNSHLMIRHSSYWYLKK